MLHSRPFLVGALLLAAAVPGQAARTSVPWTFAGRVTTAEDGSPLAGCTVTVTGHQATGYPLHWSWLDWRDPDPIVTGADGRFAFTLPAMPTPGLGDGYPARLHLELAAPGRMRVFGQRFFPWFFAEPKQECGDIAVPRGSPARFRVVDAAGMPQPGTLLQVIGEQRGVTRGSWWGCEDSVYSRADEHGVVNGTPLPVGKAKVTLPEQPGAELPPVDIAPVPGVGEAPLRDVVVPGGHGTTTLAGRVLDSAGAPVAGYVLYAIRNRNGREVWLRARSEPDGTFAIAAPDLEPDELLPLRHPRNNRYDGWHDFGRIRGGQRDFEVTLLPPGRLQLIVRLDGKPVEDLAVHAVPIDDQALGADPVRLAEHFRGGVVVLEGLRATRYSVRVHARGSSAWPSEWIDCDAVAAPQPLVVDLASAVERKLHVFTASGRPAVGCTVELIEHKEGEIDAPGRRHGQPAVDRAMTEEGPPDHSRMRHQTSVLASRGITDAGGTTVLSCRTCDYPVFVRVSGGNAQRTVIELKEWIADRAPILLTVADGCALRGTIAPAAFVAALDCCDPQDLQHAQDYGEGHNPWFWSVTHLREAHRPGIALRTRADGWVWDKCVAPLAEDGAFAVNGVPPGDYEVVLVVRKRDGKRVVDEVIEPALGKVALRVGEECTVKFATPAEILQRVR